MRLPIVLFAFHNAGYYSLDWLIDEGFEVPLVVTHKPYKRENVWFRSVAELAEARGVPIVWYEDCDEAELAAELGRVKPQIIFSVNYRKIIPESIYAIAPLGAYNVHDSLLPDYKGFAPSVWAMINGERETGVTIHEIVEEVDAGDIISQIRVPIANDWTIGDLIERLGRASLALFQATVPLLIERREVRRKQDPGSGFAKPRRTDKDDYIAWDSPSEAVRNFVRAVGAPIACAKTRWDECEMGIMEVVVEDGYRGFEHLDSGTVISKSSADGHMVIKTRTGAVRVVASRWMGNKPAALPVAGDVLV